jgi:hypothetical protein
MDAASKQIHLTDDEEFYKRNHNLNNIDNNEVLIVGEGKTVKPLDNYPRTIALFEKSKNEWQAYAQEMAGAPNPLMGKEPASGTPFALQNLVVQTGKNPHDWRRGQFAKHIEEVYRDWILPYIVEKITAGVKFLSTLSMDEMENVSEMVVTTETNKMVKERILSGRIIFQDEVEAYREIKMQEFMKNNNKFIEILKGQLKDVPLKIKINISGKQKNLAAMTDSLVNIFRQVMASVNPQTGQSVLDDPRMAKIFNQILEYSGLSMIDFQNYRKNEPAALPQFNQINQPAAAPQPAMAGQKV